MTLSMHTASVPAFVRTLTALSAILDKAAAHAAARKIEPAVLLGLRLFPDMLAFTRQVQIACDFAKGTSARLAGVEVPSYADTEATFDELKARINTTLGFIRGLPAAAFDGSDARTITVKAAGREMSFDGLTYLTQFALPNFYFHAATAYAILRASGVELGKRDFIGGMA